MDKKQQLNNYCTKYKDYKNWIIFKSNNYNFYFKKNSLAAQEIETIASRQEKAFLKIRRILKINSNTPKISYYIYQSIEEKKEMMGDDGFAQSIWHDFSIHIIYTNDIKPIGEHEDTHLLTLEFGAAIGFFQEGLAEYMQGCQWGKEKLPSKRIVKRWLQENKTIDLNIIFAHDCWINSSNQNCNIYYPLAGIFTKYLFEKYGRKKYIDFYKSISRAYNREDNKKVFEKYFENIEKVMIGFYQYVLG